MKNQKKKSFFRIYVSDYYHADPAAEDAMAAWMNLQ